MKHLFAKRTCPRARVKTWRLIAVATSLIGSHIACGLNGAGLAAGNGFGTSIETTNTTAGEAEPTAGASDSDENRTLGQAAAGAAASSELPVATPVTVASVAPSDGNLVGSAAPVVSTPPSATNSNINDLMALSGQSTHSSLTVMGMQYERLVSIVPTTAQAKFLVTAASQPSIPQSIPNAVLKNFPVTLYPFGVPSPADINQHGIGDCDGDSAFASLAYQNPKFVQNLIKDNGNGTYTVSMYDPKGHEITISLDSMFLADTIGNIQAVTGKNNVANWVTVLEKAAMKYAQVYPVIPDIGGIGSEFILPMFTGTGESFAFNAGVLTPAQLKRVVQVSLGAGRLVTGGFTKKMQIGEDITVVAHGYTILVPAGANTMISMRNPWGVSPTGGAYDTTADGVINVPTSAAWSSLIDLRIIDPGAASGPGTAVAYAAPKDANVVLARLRINERHAP